MIAIRKKENNRVNVLVSEKTAAHLPVCEINPTRSVHSTLKKYMTEIFGSDLPPHRLVLSPALSRQSKGCNFAP